MSNVWPMWKIEEQLDSGDFTKAYKAVCKDYNIEQYATIKVISVSSKTFGVDPTDFAGLDGDYAKSQMQKTTAEFTDGLKLLNSLKGHPNIVGVDDYKVVESADELLWNIYVRTELLTPFDSYVRETGITEETVMRFGRDMCESLEVCRENGVSYCDIVPENIFVDKLGRFKLANFGIERRLDSLTGGITSKGTRGNTGFGNEDNAGQSEREKIYALGMIMYRLLNGNELPLGENIKNSANLSAPRNASLSMADVIRRALSSSFATVAELKQALEKAANGVYQPTTAYGFSGAKTVQSPSIQPQQSAQTKNTPPAKRKSPALAVAVVVILLLVLVIAGLSAALIGNLSKDDTPSDGVNHSDAVDPNNSQDESGDIAQEDKQNNDTTSPENSSQNEEQSDVQPENQYMYLTDMTYSDSSGENAFTYYTVVLDNLETRYSNGIGGAAENERSWQEYKLDGEYTELRGRVVISYEARTRTDENICLWIYGDGEQLYTSGDVKGGYLPQDFVVDITGVETLRIVIEGQDMIRLVDCALYRDSSVETVSTARAVEENKQTKVNLGDLRWFNASHEGGPFIFKATVSSDLNNTYNNVVYTPYDRTYQAGAWQEYYINGEYNEMKGTVIRVPGSGTIGSSTANVMIYGDGVLLYQTQVQNMSDPQEFSVDISGVKVLRVYLTLGYYVGISDCTLSK